MHPIICMIKQFPNLNLSYGRWVDSQLRLGAGALHAFTKRVEPPSEEAVYVHKAKSPNTAREEQAIANKKRKCTVDLTNLEDLGNLRNIQKVTTHMDPDWKTRQMLQIEKT